MTPHERPKHSAPGNLEAYAVRATEKSMRIIINGAGIAGPTLAYWLRQAGHEVLLVESAPQLRSGGYVIDFGLVGYDVAEKMGLIPRIRELGYQVKEMRFVDRHGRKCGGISTDVIQPAAPRSLHEPAAFRPCGHDLRCAGWSGRDDLWRLRREYRGGGALRAGELRSCSPA